MNRKVRSPRRRTRTVGAPCAGAPGRWRLAACGVVFGLLWVALWVRAGDVQLLRGPELAEKARRQHLTAENSKGRRGDIVDRHGAVLATSLRVANIHAHPRKVEDPARAALELSRVLDVNRRTLHKKLTSSKNFVWLARSADDRTVSRVRELDLAGIELTPAHQRVYPGGHLAGQLLGFTGQDGQGLEGLEKALEEHLAGSVARRVVQRDAAGRRLESGAAVPESVDGAAVRLTIDAHLQAEAESALANAVGEYRAAWGVCLVVDVSKGDILAMAQYPFFNPNTFRDSSPRRWRNRAGLDMFEPGSTLKPLLAAAVLQEGVAAPGTVIDCENGSYVITGKKIRDTKPYEDLSLIDVVALSSNIGSAKLGLNLGAERLYNYYATLGLAEPTRVGLSAEAGGLLRPPERWYPLDLATASFGQGLGITALQLAQAYMAIARDGTTIPLRLLADSPRAAQERRVFSPTVAAEVRAMLVKAVEEGTGKNGRLPGLVVGGKTGTAQKASPGGGYGKDYVSSFVGLVPGDTPELLVLAVVDNPKKHYYGGVVAAPAVRRVMAGALAYTGRLAEPEVVAVAEGPGLGPSASGTARAIPMELNVEAEATPEPELPAAVAALAEALTADLETAEAEAGTMPDVRGVGLRQAAAALAKLGSIPRVRGTGPIVVAQQPAPGRKFPTAAPVITLGNAWGAGS